MTLGRVYSKDGCFAFVVAAGALILAYAALAAAPAAADLEPGEVRIAARPGSLLVFWAKPNFGEEVNGYQVRWRPLAVPAPEWHGPVELFAGKHHYRIWGMSVEPYEVMVTTILSDGQAGVTAVRVGTPVPREEGGSEEESREEEAEEGEEPEEPEETANVPLYSPDSLWNTPIPANVEISPHNATEIKALEGAYCTKENGGIYAEGKCPARAMSTNLNTNATLYYAPEGTPEVEVQINYPSTCDQSVQKVPIPAKVTQPGPNDEGHMALLGYKEGKPYEWDFWRASGPGEKGKKEGENVATKVGGCPKTGKWQAVLIVAGENWETGSAATGKGVHASGTPEAAGAITQKDLESEANYWPHALAFAWGRNCRGTLSWCKPPLPATSTGDGTCEEEEICIPEGARLQLEPSFNCEAGHNEITYKWEEQFCNTLRKFGMIDVDSGADYSKHEGTGIGGMEAQSWLSYTGGFHPPWRTEHSRGEAEGKLGCEGGIDGYLSIFSYQEPFVGNANCELERDAEMPARLYSHMRVLKWQ